MRGSLCTIFDMSINSGPLGRATNAIDPPALTISNASEIVAGAIKDHHRGTIVGRKTYGKWSVQSIIHLPGETGLKLTTAKFFSPAHGNYSGEGLAPDVAVPLPEDTQVTFFRGRTSDEISADADVAAAIEFGARWLHHRARR